MNAFPCPVPWRLPIGLVSRIESEAASRNIEIDALVERLLAHGLPAAFARATQEVLREPKGEP